MEIELTVEALRTALLAEIERRQSLEKLVLQISNRLHELEEKCNA
jgi:hypothetical protein